VANVFVHLEGFKIALCTKVKGEHAAKKEKHAETQFGPR
jgi:hypothetical protein